MPIYEYYCSDCQNKFEKLCRMSQVDDAADCPKCKKSSKRVLSRFASFSKDSGGMTTPVAGGGGGCATCGSSNCTSCHN